MSEKTFSRHDFVQLHSNRHRDRMSKRKIEILFRPNVSLVSLLSVQRDPPLFLLCSRTHPAVRSLARFSLARKVTMFTREALRANFFRVFHQREHKAIRRPARDIIFAALLSNGNRFRPLPPPLPQKERSIKYSSVHARDPSLSIIYVFQLSVSRNI